MTSDGRYCITIYAVSDIMRPGKASGDAYYRIRAEKGGRVIKEQRYDVHFDITTRNRSYMEIVLMALKRIRAAGAKICIILDYAFMVREFERLSKRAQNGFARTDGRPLRNKDLWEELSAALDGYSWACRYKNRSDTKTP